MNDIIKCDYCGKIIPLEDVNSVFFTNFKNQVKFLCGDCFLYLERL